MTIDQTRNEIEEEIKSKNVHEQRLKDDTALLEQQTEVYNTTTKEMEQHIADLSSQLALAEKEYQRLQAEKLEVQGQFEKISKKLADRTEENEKTCIELNAILDTLSEENRDKKRESDSLDKKLKSMMKHQAELEVSSSFP